MEPEERVIGERVILRPTQLDSHYSGFVRLASKGLGIIPEETLDRMLSTKSFGNLAKMICRCVDADTWDDLLVGLKPPPPEGSP